MELVEAGDPNCAPGEGGDPDPDAAEKAPEEPEALEERLLTLSRYRDADSGRFHGPDDGGEGESESELPKLPIPLEEEEPAEPPELHADDEEVGSDEVEVVALMGALATGATFRL